jgi:hypothetical protein
LASTRAEDDEDDEDAKKKIEEETVTNVCQSLPGLTRQSIRSRLAGTPHGSPGHAARPLRDLRGSPAMTG